MGEDIDKLYNAVIKLSKKVSELDQRNVEIESILSTFNPKTQKEDAYILDQENTVVDSYNIGGYKNVSMPNGGVIRMKSKSFCVNGRHILDNLNNIVFCSKCNAIICTDHFLMIDGEPACINCIKDELKNLDNLSLYILAALVKKFPLFKLKRSFNVQIGEFRSALTYLLKSGYIKQNVLFLYTITLYGKRLVNIAENLYDFSFMDSKTEP